MPKGSITEQEYRTACINDKKGKFRKASNDELNSRFRKLSEKELVKEYETMLDRNPPLWEYDYENRSLNFPKYILSSNDPKLLEDYLTENGELLSFKEKYYLQFRIKTARKIEQIKKEVEQANKRGEDYNKKLKTKPKELTYDNKVPVSLENATQKSFQTSGNGCWSCFLQVAAHSRGSDVTQEEIRAYRPMLSEQEGNNVSDLEINDRNRDDMRNALEMSDALFAFVPNTQVNELEISYYDENVKKQNISQKQYLDSAVKYMEKVIRHAILFDKSPIGVLMGNHYLTITGIDGDEISYKNSLAENPKDSANHTYKRSLRSLLGSKLLNSQPIQFTWLSDIKLQNDCKSFYGVPSVNVEMQKDGKVQFQNEDLLEGGKAYKCPTQREGGLIVRYAGREMSEDEHYMRDGNDITDGIVKVERVYMPKQLDAKYLTNAAIKRSKEDEQKLQEIDRDFFGITSRNKYKRDPNAKPIAEQKEEKRKNATRKSIETINKGLNRDMFKLFFVKKSSGGKPFDVQGLDNENLEDSDNVFKNLFGEDIYDHEEYLKRFKCKMNPQGEEISIYDYVKAELIKLKLYEDIESYPVDIKNDVLLKNFVNRMRDERNSLARACVRAAILYYMSDPTIDLVYDDGKGMKEQLKAVPPVNYERKDEKQTERKQKVVRHNTFTLKELQLAKDGKLRLKSYNGPKKSRNNNNLFDEIQYSLDDDFYDVGIRLNYDYENSDLNAFDDFGNIDYNAFNDYDDGLGLYDRYNGNNIINYENDEGTIFNFESFKLKPSTQKNTKKTTTAKPVVEKKDKNQDKKIKNVETAKSSKVTTKKVTTKKGKSKQVIEKDAVIRIREDETIPDVDSVEKSIKTRIDTNFKTLDSISTAAANISRGVDRVSHFYLSDSTGHFNNLKRNLRDIKEITATLNELYKKNKKVTVADRDRLLQLLDEGINNSTAYLSRKTDQLRENPMRKDDPGKEDNEQPRIKAVLGALENLIELRSALKYRFKLEVNLYEERAVRKELVSFYKNELISNVDDYDEMYETSKYYRIPFTDKGSDYYQMFAIDALFGFIPRTIGPYKKEAAKLEVPDKNGKTAISKIPVIENNFKVIASEELKRKKPNPNSKVKGDRNLYTLTEKDFAALSFGAAGSWEAYVERESALGLNEKPMYRKLSSEDRYMKFHASFMNSFTNTNSEGLDVMVPYVVKGREIASNALQAYSKGDKQPLAKLIKDSIKSFIRITDTPTQDARAKQFYAEMGLRMKGMLERDRDLRRLALNEGLTQNDLNRIITMEREGYYLTKVNVYANAIESGKHEIKNDYDKARIYTDFMMHRMLDEEYSYAAKAMQANEDYKNEYKVLMREAIKDYLTNLSDENIAENIKAIFGDDPELDDVLKRYSDKVTEAEKTENQEEQKKAKNTINQQLRYEIETYIKMRYEFIDIYEADLLKRYQQNLKKIKSSDKNKLSDAGIKSKLFREQQLPAAIKLEESNISTLQAVEVTKKAEEEKKAEELNPEEQNLGEINTDEKKLEVKKPEVNKYPLKEEGEARSELLKKYSDYKEAFDSAGKNFAPFKEIRKVIRNKLFKKYAKQSELLDRINDKKYELDLYKKTMEYIQDSGFLDMSYDDFKKNVSDNPKTGNRPLITSVKNHYNEKHNTAEKEKSVSEVSSKDKVNDKNKSTSKGKGTTLGSSKK